MPELDAETYKKLQELIDGDKRLEKRLAKGNKDLP